MELLSFDYHTVRIFELHGELYKTVHVDSLTKYGLAIIVFYITTYIIFPKYKDRYFLLTISMIALLFIHNTIRYHIYDKLFVLIDIEYQYSYYYWGAFPSGFWFFYQYSLFGLGFFIYRNSKKINSNLINEQQKNHDLETKNLKLEYKFLRAQINPHFLYNVLGFFYGKVKQQDSKAGRGIELLTAMMRYSIREGEADDKVSLTEELHAVKNLLELQQLRFEDTTYIEEIIEPGMSQLRIVPHILVTMVENACKHGDLTNKSEPLQINAYTNNEWFVFEVKNKQRTGRMIEVSDGTGLINLEERIRLQYSDQQQFSYGSAKGFFTVVFKLKIERMQSDTSAAEKKMKTNTILTNNHLKEIKWLPT